MKSSAAFAELQPVAMLIGSWLGEGRGDYPTIESFRYGEKITFECPDKPVLVYTQRTWSIPDGQPLHAELGYLRCPAPGRVEWVIAHPNGIAEVSEGTVGDGVIDVASTSVRSAASAKEVSRITRRIRLAGDTLTYELDMEAVGEKLGPHLKAELRRSDTA